MRQKKIRLRTMAEVKEFVREASRCEFEVDISYNHVVVDGKSILGVLSLDLSSVLSVTYYGEDERFEMFLETKAEGNNGVA